jgi:hypothetical protein
MVEYMLTTEDNPFNPWTQYDEWAAYDDAHGYGTLSLLGRIVRTSNDLSYAEEVQATNDAIEEILRMNVLGIFRKVPEPAN